MSSPLYSEFTKSKKQLRSQSEFAYRDRANVSEMLAKNKKGICKKK
jgi:hypothetical protein